MRRCGVLNSVLTKRVEYTRNAVWGLVDDKGGDVTDKNRKILDAVLSPNAKQNLTDLVSDIRHMLDVYGRAYVVKSTAEGMSGSSLYVAPTPFVQVNTTTLPYMSFDAKDYVKSYTITINGRTLELSTDEVFVINDVLAQDSMRLGVADITQGFSRLEALEDNINTSKTAYNVQNELLENRGMLGIISLLANDMSTLQSLAMPQTKEEKASLTEKLKNYGLGRGKEKYLLTGMDAKFTSVSASLQDLSTLDFQNANTRIIADAYGCPSILLDMEAAKFTNLEEAKLSFYTSTIIPSTQMIADHLTKILGLKGLKIVCYYDHLELFQSAKLKQAQAFAGLVSALGAAEDRGYVQREEAINEFNRLRP